MANNKTTTVVFEGSDGKRYDVPNDADSIRQMQSAGFRLADSGEEKGLLGRIAEAARGAEEFVDASPVTKYNPLLKPEQYLLKGIANLGGAKPSKELEQPKPVDSGTVVFKGADGKRYDVPNDEQSIKAMEAAGFARETASETAAEDVKTNPAFEGVRGAVRAYGESGLNEYLFGVPKLAADPAEKNQREALSDAFPIASAAGSVAGFAANLMTPGLNLG